MKSYNEFKSRPLKSLHFIYIYIYIYIYSKTIGRDLKRHAAWSLKVWCFHINLKENIAGKSRWCDFQTYVKLAEWIFSVNELPAAVNLNGVVLWVLLLGRSEHGGLLSQGVPFQNHWQVLWILLENEGLLQRKMWNALTRGSKTLKKRKRVLRKRVSLQYRRKL